MFATVGKRIAGFEALLRWDHPEFGSIPPVELIPVAEAAGAIVCLGRWVLAEACRQAMAWQRARRGAGAVGQVVRVREDRCSKP